MPHELTVDQENSPTDYPEDSSLAPRSRSLSNADECARHATVARQISQTPSDGGSNVPHLMADTPRKVVHHHDDDDDSGASSSSDEHAAAVLPLVQNGCVTGEVQNGD